MARTSKKKSFETVPRYCANHAGSSNLLSGPVEIARSTFEYRVKRYSGGEFVVTRYHFTDICFVSYDAGGKLHEINLYTGGFKTRSTKDRLNLALTLTPLRVYQYKNEWYLYHRYSNKLLPFKENVDTLKYFREFKDFKEYYSCLKVAEKLGLGVL